MKERFRLGKINFCSTKKPSNSIQKLLMMETVSTVIVNSYLIYQDPASGYHLELSFLQQ